ncbi:MAG: DUF4364 family protein [Clostridia bacterium]|nr:DUF4364 family protein [Clostridia bacterium]
MPSASARNLNNIKIFVLYLMRNINYPMNFATVNDIVRQNDYVMYLDFAEAFHQMLDSGLICEDGKDETGDTLYSVTKRGAMVAEELHRDIPPAILDQSLSCALRYLDFQRRSITVDCTSERRGDNSFDVTLTLKEQNKILLSTTVNVDSEYRSHQIRQAFRERPDVIYRGIMALLAGKVDFLFDK